MDLYGAVMLFLMMLPAFVIGWIGGMLHMRRNYLSILRQERVQNARLARYTGAKEREARYLGYAVGYREGQRAR